MKPFNMKDPVRTDKALGDRDYLLHGDVIVLRDKIPSDFESWPMVEDSCLAYGEATGHAHKIFGGDFDLRENPKTKGRHLRVVKECYLRHQEHREISIPPGDYRIGIQREYDPYEKLTRRVED